MVNHQEFSGGKMIIDIVSRIIGPVLDKIFPNKEEAMRAKAQLLELENRGELAFIEAQAKVLVAEAQSESWITRSWRPITMLCFVFLILNHYFLTPWINSTFGLNMINLDIPDRMWGLMEIGIGGYVMGRSAVQFAKVWKDKSS